MTERVQAPKSLPGWVWGGLFGCMVIMGWMGWNKYRPVTAAERAQLAERIGGEQNVAIIQNAERVYATRIRIKGNKPDWESLEDFEAIAEPILFNENDQQLVKQLLQTPRNYIYDPAACRPRWGFRLRFVTGDDAMDVWVCLECHHLLFVRDGEEVGGLSFGRMRNDVDALALRLFPGDRSIEEAVE